MNKIELGARDLVRKVEEREESPSKEGVVELPVALDGQPFIVRVVPPDHPAAAQVARDAIPVSPGYLPIPESPFVSIAGASGSAAPVSPSPVSRSGNSVSLMTVGSLVEAAEESPEPMRRSSAALLPPSPASVQQPPSPQQLVDEDPEALEKERRLSEQIDGVAQKTAITKKDLSVAIKQISKNDYSDGWHLETIGNVKCLIFQENEFYDPVVYVLANKLGEGGSGAVWRLVSLDDARESVLKIAKNFHEINCNDKDGNLDMDRVLVVKEWAQKAQEEMRNEMNMLFLLNKEGPAAGIQSAPFYRVPCLIETSEGEKEFGYIIELYEGDVTNKPPQNLRELRRCFSDMSKALVHSQKKLGIRHGDIKPQNFYRSANGFHLADWGTAIQQDQFRQQFQDLYGAWSSKYEPKWYKKLSENALGSASRCIEDLKGEHTYSFSPHDRAELEKAFIEGDFEKFLAIEKARDIYSMGISFVCILLEINDPTIIVEDIRDPAKPKALNLKCLTANLVALFRQKGMTHPQIEMIDRMLRSYNERPTPDEMAQVFAE